MYSSLWGSYHRLSTYHFREVKWLKLSDTLPMESEREKKVFGNLQISILSGESSPTDSIKITWSQLDLNKSWFLHPILCVLPNSQRIDALDGIILIENIVRLSTTACSL